MKRLFQNFYKEFSYLEIEELISYFSVLGGVKLEEKWDYISDFNTTLKYNFINNFTKLESLIKPSYLLESSYRKLLTVIAKGDGKIVSSFKKANLSQSVGYRILDELIELGVLKIEYSRETPLKTNSKNKLKKEYRSYKIQHKIRFIKPFYRFWFGFVVGYEEALLLKNADEFLRHFETCKDRVNSLIYEQLCNEVLKENYKNKILSSGSYWNIQSEFDILLVTNEKKVILGECKYKNRKVCKNELNKLKSKSLALGKIDTYALFSKSGFSNELLAIKDDNLLLFDLKDLNKLLII